jgi:preprotein translocase subunit SecG
MIETALILIGLWFVTMMLIGILVAREHYKHDHDDDLDDQASALPLHPKYRKHHPSDREET